MRAKIEEFKKWIESQEQKWRVCIINESPTLDIQAKTIYLKLDKEDRKNKQKTIGLTFIFVDTLPAKGELDFRDKVLKFIDYLKNNFEERNCFSIDQSYSVSYSSIGESSLGVGEIKTVYDYTLLSNRYRDSKVMDKINWEISIGGKI